MSAPKDMSPEAVGRDIRGRAYADPLAVRAAKARKEKKR